MITYAPRFRSGWRRSLFGLGLLGLVGVAAPQAAWAVDPPAKPATAAAKPATAGKPGAKKPAPKRRAPPPEWHGEATPREVVQGTKVLEALLDLGGSHMAAGRYDQAIKAFTDATNRAPLEPRP